MVLALVIAAVTIVASLLFELGTDALIALALFNVSLVLGYVGDVLFRISSYMLRKST